MAKKEVAKDCPRCGGPLDLWMDGAWHCPDCGYEHKAKPPAAKEN